MRLYPGIDTPNSECYTYVFRLTQYLRMILYLYVCTYNIPTYIPIETYLLNTTK